MDFQLLNFHTSLSGTFPKKPDESSPNSDESDNLTLDGQLCLLVWPSKGVKAFKIILL